MDETPPADEPAASRWEQSLRTLVLRMQTGERESLVALYDQTRAIVYGLALRITRDAAAAEEATLDTYRTIYRTASEWDPARAGAMTWLLHVARASALARAPRDAAVDDVSAAAVGVEQSHPLQGARAQAREALGALTELQRRALELAYFSARTPDDVAAALGVTPDEARRCLREAVSALRTARGTP